MQNSGKPKHRGHSFLKKNRVIQQEETKKLIAGAQQGDAEALDTLLDINKGLVYSAARAKNRRLPWLDIEDLVQEGLIGLQLACMKFNKDKKCKFSTYAFYWIKQRIERYSEKNATTVRLPCEQLYLKHHLAEIEKDLTQRFGQTPDFNEVITEAGISEADAEIRGQNLYILPLEAAQNIQSEKTLDNSFWTIEIKKRLEAVLESARREKKVSFRNLVIIKLRFGLIGEEHTLEYIAGLYNLSRERIRQIIKNTLSVLMKHYGDSLRKLLQEFN